jgi:SPP1 gp7 family putative phage head morphogenesis protein
MARGDNSQTILKTMNERFPDVERSNMARLIRTEGTYVFNEAQAKTWENSGIEEYVYSAFLDKRTSDICQNLDGQTFKWSDREPGVNFPPMHPNCRSTYLLPDLDEEWLMDQMRKANPGMFKDRKTPIAVQKGNVASQATSQFPPPGKLSKSRY